MTPPQTSALQAQIDKLGDRMDAGFAELKNYLRAYEERTRTLETREAGCQPIITSRMDAAWRMIDGHGMRMDEIDKQASSKAAVVDKQIARLMAMYNLFVFIGSALGLSIISLIGSILTGHAEITFK